ncbi:MAG: site-specific integrase [Gemmatimonadota bacterium]
MQSVIRTREYSRKTELAYVGWAQRFLAFHARGGVSPGALTAPHAAAFLEHLAASERLSARSRNQAASALTFLFREGLRERAAPGDSARKGPAAHAARAHASRGVAGAA